MSHLRLVAGTDVTGPARKKARAPAKKRAVKPEANTKTLENQACATIRALKVGADKLSVAQLLEEAHRNCDGAVPVATALSRNADICRMLSAVGIHVKAAVPDQELDVHCYGLVLNPRQLLRVCPALKPCASVLEGLTL